MGSTSLDIIFEEKSYVQIDIFLNFFFNNLSDIVHDGRLLKKKLRKISINNLSDIVHDGRFFFYQNTW